MAYLTLNRKKLRNNYNHLKSLFDKRNISWAVVTKLLCGSEPFVKEVIDLGIKEICDSRISNLALIKELAPDVQTIYIKPPAKEAIEDVITYADVSFNTELETMRWLSAEAVKQNKLHKVVVMIELGDLREGVMGNELIDFYGKVFELPKLEIVGIGANLNCLHGVMPSQDKLIQLSLYKQLIEAKFNRKIAWVTGGTSVVIPLIHIHQLPAGINHFRVGEALYFGKDLVHDTTFDGMYDDVLELYAQIIEITEKPKIPIGNMEANPSGDTYQINEADYGKKSHRAILDVGLLDVSSDYLIPEDESIEFVGASSDMLVVDLDNNQQHYQVGEILRFKLKYMGALSLLNSAYIEKRVI